MTVMLTKIAVTAGMPVGTQIGKLTAYSAGASVPASFQLGANAAAAFEITGGNMLAIATAKLAAGFYSLRVRARGTAAPFKETAWFMITVNPAPAPPPPAPPPPPPPPAPPPAAG